MNKEDLTYAVLATKDPDELSRAVTSLMREGWKLHGELKLQSIADEAALTFARLIYIQAMYREVEK